MSYAITSTDIDTSKFSPHNFAGLKAKFPDLDDSTIARYLIARNDDLGKATGLLTKAMNWRAKRMPVLKKDCEEEIGWGAVYVRGTDKEGHPILHITPGLIDTSTRDLERTAKAVMWWMEVAISKLPPTKSKFTILLNRTSGGGGDLEFTRNFSRLFQDQHPERLKRAIVYPSSLVFWSIFNVAKWFFDPVTRNKVAPVMYYHGVQEFIDDEWIPESMGGKMTYKFNTADYPDPYTPEFVEAELARRAANTSTSSKTFFQPEDADEGNYDEA